MNVLFTQLIGLVGLSVLVAGGCGVNPTEAGNETPQVLLRAVHGAQGPYQQDPETDLIEGFFDELQGGLAYRFHGNFVWEWSGEIVPGAWIIRVEHVDPTTGEFIGSWTGRLPEGGEVPADIDWDFGHSPDSNNSNAPPSNASP